jgi:hypothetical protein
MSGLVAAYDSSDDEAQPAPSTSTSILPPSAAGKGADEDDESDDEQLEAQARADAFGLSEANGSSAVQKRKDANGKVVIASAPDVLREVGTPARQKGGKRKLMYRTRIMCRLLSLLDRRTRSSMSISHMMI